MPQVSAHMSSQRRHLMREDLAAVNVTRTYTLAASNIAIFTDTEKMVHARRADRFWLLGYTTMFLAPSLVLFLIGLRVVASIWLAFWLVYLFFVVRYFPRIQTPRESQ